MRTIIAGLGIQGEKRRRIAASDVVSTVDPIVPGDFNRVEDVPLESYDAALLCVPDGPKVDLIRYLLSNGKHVLVEKPLISGNQSDLESLASLAEKTGTVCYTAYNHRFEPHFIRLRDTVASGILGKIYRARFFYGNGTARDVRNSVWRDKGTGVLPDLGSHLLDTLLFIFGAWPEDLKIWSACCFENSAFDHIICGGRSPIHIEMEMTLLSWRNHFVAEVYGENGSAHIESLCKWGPSSFSLRRRVLPSGRPPEESVTLTRPDPTWEAEYDHFKNLCAGESKGNIENDLRINAMLNKLAIEALEMKPL
jgi:scyllo-inositol 2-dehydrogenase (NADP+)